MSQPRKIAMRPVQRPNKEKAIIAAAWARIAATPDGEIIVNALRNRTTFRVVGPDASDGALRAAEGNRQLMLEIDELIASGGRTPTPS